MSKQVQFKVSLIAATISMMMAGSAFAATGNELVGPDMNTSGAATVKIDQSGTGNITSSTGATGAAAFVVDQSAGATTALTIQQVGTSNTLGLSSYTNAATSIQVFQGMDMETGNTGGITGGATKTVDANVAVIEIGKDATDRAGATDVFLTQQGDSNVAGLHLGKTAGVFTGTLNLMQVRGDSNAADVTINGQTTTGQTFNIGQSGGGNTLTVVAVGNQATGMTLDFGGVTFDRAVALPAATDVVGSNNAQTYTYNTAGTNANLKSLFASAQTGINLQGTDAFKIKALGGTNKVQVDLSTAAATGNKVDVNLNDGSSNFAVYGSSGAAVNLGGTAALNVENSKELVVYASEGAVSVNGVTFDGNGYFSTADGGSITMSGGTVTANGMSVLQSGAAHTFSSTNNGSSTATWNVAQTGTVVSSIIANNTAAGATGGTFALTQTSEADAHAMTLNNSAAGTTWTVTQTGAGAKTLNFTNSTPSATITATQTGAKSQSATGIDFAALSGSFTLVQR